VHPNRIAKLKEAITKMVNYGNACDKTDLILEIKRKPELNTDELEEQLHTHVQMLRDAGVLPQNTDFTIQISDYDFISLP